MQKQLLLKTMHTLQIVGKEIEIHGKLFHRNITRLFNVYENKTDIYLIMEHAEKGSFKNRRIFFSSIGMSFLCASFGSARDGIFFFCTDSVIFSKMLLIFVSV